MPQPKTFNEVIRADVFYLKPADRKFAVLSIIDVGTKFMATYLLHESPTSPLWKRCGSATLALPRS